MASSKRFVTESIDGVRTSNRLSVLNHRTWCRGLLDLPGQKSNKTNTPVVLADGPWDRQLDQPSQAAVRFLGAFLRGTDFPGDSYLIAVMKR